MLNNLCYFLMGMGLASFVILRPDGTARRVFRNTDKEET